MIIVLHWLPCLVVWACRASHGFVIVASMSTLRLVVTLGGIVTLRLIVVPVTITWLRWVLRAVTCMASHIVITRIPSIVSTASALAQVIWVQCAAT